MFPLRDENPTLRASVITYLVIILNAACWVRYQGLGFGHALPESICKFGLVPGELLGRLAAGAQIPLGEGLSCVFDGQPGWHTILTSMFMHGGWLHIIGNMWFLAIFGDNVEDAMGPIRFTIFYLLCGTAAAAAQTLADPASAVPMVGASGAIGGIMGGYAVLYPRAPVQMLFLVGIFPVRFAVPAFLMLGYWFFIQFISGFGSLGVHGKGGVAVWAHVGGFLCGALLVRLFSRANRLETGRKKRGRMDGFFYRAR